MDTKQAVRNAVKGIPNVRYFKRWDDPKIGGRVAGKWDPRFVMVHGTAGTNSRSILERGLGHEPVPGSHFLVNRDGSLDVQTHRQAYHAGVGGPLRGIPRNTMNAYAWGIEFETLQRRRDLTAPQVRTGAMLIAGLLRETGLGLDDIIQHKEWNPVGKPYDTRYTTAWWREQVKPYMTSKVEEQVVTTSTAPPILRVTHSGVVGERARTSTPVAEPVVVPGTRMFTIAMFTLPPGWYSVTMQVRSPKGSAAGRVEVTRVVGEGETMTSTALAWNATTAAEVLGGQSFLWCTPIQGLLVPGGHRIGFRIKMPPGAHAPMRFLCQAVRVL